MIVLNICKNLCRSRLRHCGASIVHLNNILNNRLVDRGQCQKTGITERFIFPSSKSYSTETQSEPEILLPPLCDFPPVIWPGLFKTLRNCYVINIVIKNNLDRDFVENEFITASKQAVYVVSRSLAHQNYDDLEELVTPDALSVLKTPINTLSDRQKDLLNVQDGEIYFSCTDDVNISYTEENGIQRTFVEIMVIHHYLRDLKNVMLQPVTLFGTLPPEQEKILVVNYRFRREVTEGVDAPWIVNMINYFSPRALVNYLNVCLSRE